jgi:hypothetical protein
MKRTVMTGALALLGVAAAVTPVLALGSGAGASTRTAVTRSSVTRTAVTHLSPLIHVPPALGSHLTHGTTSTSSHWSGYADTNETFQAVTGSWVEPAVTCGSGSSGFLGLGGSAAYASFWVGLDGYSSSSVEQIGSDSDCSSSGAPSYYAWYEMYPAGSVDLSTTQYPVKPGDTLTGMVESNAGGTSYALLLKDTGPADHWNYSITLAGSGLSRSSAEWVAEAPSSCELILCSTLSLANFGKVAFTNDYVSDVSNQSGSITAFPDVAITLASSSSVEATPSALNPSGDAFSVTWDS